eukprot:NODE_12745_length_376_cov_6.501529_g11593_i0.p1 GENE.NODE_12745_length_376_cov_6.501529_g11593_i0~~NODE_12745_length_376_cov_6.501529_g11593_i0.p1  ORF type:complete len:101 (+),score=2.84 NODE_12745_length_376_cov_6.501529_g11593_i0:45-347(+)
MLDDPASWHSAAVPQPRPLCQAPKHKTTRTALPTTWKLLPHTFEPLRTYSMRPLTHVGTAVLVCETAVPITETAVPSPGTAVLAVHTPGVMTLVELLAPS